MPEQRTHVSNDGMRPPARKSDVAAKPSPEMLVLHVYLLSGVFCTLQVGTELRVSGLQKNIEKAMLIERGMNIPARTQMLCCGCQLLRPCDKLKDVLRQNREITVVQVSADWKMEIAIQMSIAVGNQALKRARNLCRSRDAS
eukprot:TRINITY_DN48014_c0_g1_i1.p1 TRINITY_DN48014_c0_g1~~TRINITY_DN48014_c0_g1_i1.p1  ORF type:complete len:142 (-),score=22.36 TRINITY_DN48014_c0_g1_i1:163-588(-)